MLKRFGSHFYFVLVLLFAISNLVIISPVSAATLLDNIGETNNKGTNIFRSNIWTAVRFTAGAGATITSVTLNLDETAGNYTGFSTYTGGVIKFYNDNSGVVGDAIAGTLGYTSTNTGTGHTVFAEATGTITLDDTGDYWLAMTCASCANVDYEETDSTTFSGESGWETIIDDTTVSTSNNSGSTWNAPYSSSTFGMALYTLVGTETDSTAPTVSTLAPADGVTDIEIDSDLVMTFSEVVDVETGNITIKKVSDDSSEATIDVTSDQVTGTGTATITINPTDNLTNGTQYYVEIDATAFDDAAGNSYAGIRDTSTWNFTTVALPVVSSGTSSSLNESSGNTFLSAPDGQSVSLKPLLNKEKVAAGSKDNAGNSAAKVVPGDMADFAVKIPDTDQVKEVYIRIFGKRQSLQDKDGDFTFETGVQTGLQPGSYPYTITADYGIFTLSTKGEIEVGSSEQLLADKASNLFAKVFRRQPQPIEKSYWDARATDGTKKDEAELLGAMQWQQGRGLFSSRLPGFVLAINSPH